MTIVVIRHTNCYHDNFSIFLNILYCVFNVIFDTVCSIKLFNSGIIFSFFGRYNTIFGVVVSFCGTKSQFRLFLHIFLRLEYWQKSQELPQIIIKYRPKMLQIASKTIYRPKLSIFTSEIHYIINHKTLKNCFKNTLEYRAKESKIAPDIFWMKSWEVSQNYKIISFKKSEKCFKNTLYIGQRSQKLI